MKNIVAVFSILFSLNYAFGQEIYLKTTLNSSLKESSGLIVLNQKLITFNDSGGEPQLFEFDEETGKITGTVEISNATNVDWEDICYDNNYIYVGDFGNNYGSRTDLKIYRILISDYFNTTDNTVFADTISFSYADQTDFTPSPYSTNFDAESLISYEDNLYLFTKNWEDLHTNIYVLPKTPGSYEIEKIGEFNARCLVTGADYNPLSNTIVLTGYRPDSNFIMEINDFDVVDFSIKNIDRYAFSPPQNTSTQIESISHVGTYKYYLTSEKYKGKSPALMELISKNVATNEELQNEVSVYPNPASDKVKITCDDFSFVEIYDLKGALIRKTTDKNVYIGDLDRGIYIFEIRKISGQKPIQVRITKE